MLHKQRKVNAKGSSVYTEKVMPVKHSKAERKIKPFWILLKRRISLSVNLRKMKGNKTHFFNS